MARYAIMNTCNFWIRTACTVMFAAAALTAAAAENRPPIVSISHICVYASDAQASDNFYAHVLGAAKGPDPQNPQGARYYFSPTQFVEVLPLPAAHGLSRISCVAFNTQDASELHEYLQSHDVQGLTEVRTGSDGSHWFAAKDPEGNEVQFVEPGKLFVMPLDAKPISTRIIHVGYMVHNRAAEDKFYRDVLGFRPYWFGAMQPGYINWVSQQVPDGRDWLEYMLVGEGSTVPLSKVDERQLGVLNHFSLGVSNMEQAVTTLYRENRVSQRHDGPQMGKDGKWQTNFYDPDGTRVEFMEFQPVMEPCCSQFTSASPNDPGQ